MKNHFLSVTVLAISLAFNFVSCSGNSKSNAPLAMKGSKTECEVVKKLAEAYATNGEFKVEAEEVDETAAINALLSDKADMASSSRPLNDNELEAFKKKGIEVLSVNYAVDAMVIITHPRLGIQSLTLEELKLIFSGKINNWEELKGVDRRIVKYGREANSGMNKYFKDNFLKTEFSPDMIALNTTKEILNKVAEDTCGIGFVGLGFLMDEQDKPSDKVWAMPLSLTAKHIAYSPFEIKDVVNGNYLLARPLYQHYKLPLRENVKKFLLYELSGNSKETLRKFGFFPIDDNQKEINKVYGYQ
ncbi:MAG: substrate-binding domain-containing protein [Bacteroidia bacterium]|nr:substrate-binding domain-containing protein [Bacteroidia bacterium]